MPLKVHLETWGLKFSNLSFVICLNIDNPVFYAVLRIAFFKSGSVVHLKSNYFTL